jgi:CHAT domain-containing protein
MKYTFIFLFTFLCLAAFSQNYKSLKEQAEKEFDNSNFEAALQLATKALRAVEADKKAERDDVYKIKADHSVYSVFNNKVDEGITALAGIISEIETRAIKTSTEIYVRFQFGAVLKNMGLYADALPQFKRTYELCKTTSYEKKDVALIIASYAECNQYLFRFQDAEILFKEAISYCEKENLKNTSDYAFFHSNIALLYVDMFFETKALENYKKAESIFVSVKDTAVVQYAAFLMDYGTFLTNTYQYEKALPILLRSKALYQKLFGEKSLEYAGILNNLGYTYEKTGRLTETEQFYTKALEIKKANPGVRIENYLNALNNLIFFYHSVGRKQEATELIDELEKGMVNPKFQDTLKRMDFAQNLAMWYSENKMYIKARNYYNDALNYSKSIYGDDNILMGQMYIALSVLYWEEKKYEDALNSVKKVQKILDGNVKVNVAESFTLLRNYAVMLNRFGQPKQAEPLIDQALKMVQSKKVTNQKEITDLYLQKAQISAMLNKIDAAMEYFKKYMDMKYAEIENNFSYMTEMEKLQYLESLEQNVKEFVTTITNFLDKRPDLIQMLLDFRIRTKGILLNNISKIKRGVNKLNDPELNQKFENMKLNRENISKLMSLNTDEYPAALSEVAALKKEADQLEKDISLKVSTENLIDQKKLSWKDIQKQLAPGECAIEILQANLIYQNDSGGVNYTYMVVKNTGNPVFFYKDRSLKWESNILSKYRTFINSRKEDADLYLALWSGLDKMLKDIHTVYISPDGIYNQVNLNTIFNAETKKYVIEEKKLHYLVTLADLPSVKTSKFKEPKDAVLVGNPSFGYDLSKLKENKDNFGSALAVRGSFGFMLTELPGTKTEVETIKGQLVKKSINTILLTEEKANEAEVKRLKNPTVLHFATHGFFMEDFDDETMSALSQTEQSYYKNPMVRSGIFFSGANNTYSLNTTNMNRIKEFEDGTLTSYEAMNLELDSTELVVLSACETGLGKVKNGEGVFGLQRAFKMAGAKSVIMSLWPVSDDATMKLMTTFYEKWSVSGDLYNSFRDAQMEVKKVYPEPYFWGAFVLNGR